MDSFIFFLKSMFFFKIVFFLTDPYLFGVLKLDTRSNITYIAILHFLHFSRFFNRRSLHISVNSPGAAFLFLFLFFVWFVKAPCSSSSYLRVNYLTCLFCLQYMYIYISLSWIRRRKTWWVFVSTQMSKSSTKWVKQCGGLGGERGG